MTSKPCFTNAHLCFSATDCPHEIPAPRWNQAALSLCRKLSNHHRPRPMRKTASHSAAVSHVVVLVAGVMRASPSCAVDQVEPCRHDRFPRLVVAPVRLLDDEGHRPALGLLLVGVGDASLAHEH